MSLKENIYQNIYQDILSGTYRPNEILTESALSAKYQTSKSPIREALIELCKEQILQNIPRLGYQVVPVTLKDMLDLIDFRVDIEVSNLKRNYRNISEKDIFQLFESAQISEQEIQNPIWDKNQSFHLKLYEIGDNRYGYNELKEIMRRNKRYLSQYFHTAWKQASVYTKEKEYHLEIIDALCKKEIDKASAFLTADIYSIKEEILKNI